MASMTVPNQPPIIIAADKAEAFKKVCKESDSFSKAMERANRCCPGFSERKVVVIK